MTPAELGVLTELAAVRYILSEAGQEDLLETLGPQERSKIIDQASIREKTLDGQLEDYLRNVYIAHGEFSALISDVDSSRPRETLAENLEHIAGVLMDRRFPQHPQFLADPKKADLELLLGWMVQAGETNVSVSFDEATGKALKNLGQPLELVNLGQSKASLRLDSRYIKDVLQRADKDSVAWGTIAEHLRDTYGLQPLIIDLFLCFLCQRDHRALQELVEEPVEVHIGMANTSQLRLQRGKVLTAPEWSRLRELGPQLFGVKAPSAQRSLQAQDRSAAEYKTLGQAKRTVLQALYKSLVELGVVAGARLKELGDTNSRLSAFAQTTSDSHKVLSEWLAAWPDDATDPLRLLVQQAETIRDALALLNTHAWSNLKAGKNHPTVGTQVQAHLDTLDLRLEGAQIAQPLTKEWFQTWNQTAQQLIQQLIQQLPPQPPIQPPQPPPIHPPQPPPQPPPTPPAGEENLCSAEFDPNDPDAVTDFLASVRKALSAHGDGPIRVTLKKEKSK
jgi:hypothetical protein